MAAEANETRDGLGAVFVVPVTGMGEVMPGESLGLLLASAIGASDVGLVDGDVVVVTQKVVSKAEGQLVAIDVDDPIAKIALVEAEAVRVLRRRGELLITETRHGFVCANSGVDLSNVASGQAALLPVDPDRSARGIVAALVLHFGV
jgi:coenzyme F420-0:L-glutamate ligase/coenzyme F420-1:gamma-L-glutamate ligase